MSELWLMIWQVWVQRSPIECSALVQNFDYISGTVLWASILDIAYFRPDNADIRLTELAHKYGAVSQERYMRFTEMRERLERCKHALENVRMSLKEWSRRLPQITSQSKGKDCPGCPIEYPLACTAYQLLSNYDVSLDQISGAYPEHFREIADLVTDEDLGQRLKNEGSYAITHRRMVQKVCFFLYPMTNCFADRRTPKRTRRPLAEEHKLPEYVRIEHWMPGKTGQAQASKLGSCFENRGYNSRCYDHFVALHKEQWNGESGLNAWSVNVVDWS